MALNFVPKEHSKLKLEDLLLSNNPVREIGNKALDNVYMLKTLGLKYTKLTRLPLAMKMLVTPTNVWMDNINRLACTCQESELILWFKSLPGFRISGNCGIHKIEDYLKSLAATCPVTMYPI